MLEGLRLQADSFRSFAGPQHHTVEANSLKCSGDRKPKRNNVTAQKATKKESVELETDRASRGLQMLHRMLLGALCHHAAAALLSIFFPNTDEP